MTSSTGEQMFPNTSRSKGNQTMKFGLSMKFSLLIEYIVRRIFLQKTWGKGGREGSFRPLFIFKKGFIWGKSKLLAPLFQYILAVLELYIQ